MVTSSAGCPADADNLFGPQVDNCVRVFDFTLLFEDSILSILPLTICLGLVLLRIISLRKSGPKVDGTVLCIFKLSFLLVYSALELAILVLWCLPTAFRSKASITSAALSLITSFVICLCSSIEHRHSLRSSSILSSYFAVSLLLDVARTRTLWLLPRSHTIAVIFTIATIWKLPLLVLETRSKRAAFKKQYTACAPEDASGIIGRSFLWWINPLFWSGYSKTLSVNDLTPVSEALNSGHLLSNSTGIAKSCLQGSKDSLFTAILSDLKWPFLSIILPRLCVVALKLLQPFLIQSTLNWFAAPITSDSRNNGYGLVGAYVLVYVGLAMFQGLGQSLTYKFVAMTRGTLVSRIYQQTLQLSVTSVSGSAPLTLMSTDVELAALALWLLERELGVGCVAPIVVSILCLFITGALGPKIGAAQTAWVGAVQKRVHVTASVLGAMKSLRLSGLAEVLSSIIQNLRVRELDVSKGFRNLIIVNVCLAYSTTALAPVLGFMIYILIARHNGQTLETAQAFAALTLFALVSTPIDQVIQTLPALLSGVACCKRMQSFLSGAPRQDYRRVRRSSMSTEIISEKKPADEPAAATKAEGASVMDITPASDADISIENGTFKWEAEREPILKNIDLNINRSELTVIVGPISSGKTSLLHVILGEITFAEGLVEVSSTDMAYCSQTPWMRNRTIQENILGESLFDRHWYRKVVRACVLEKTLTEFSLGDQTVVGSKGLSLSGGEKQRIALARTVYARKPIVILDDVLSGLDATTEALLFNRLFKSGGLFLELGTTVVLATHSVAHISCAQQIISLAADGTITAKGDFEQLAKADAFAVDIEEIHEGPAAGSEDNAQPNPVFAPASKEESVKNDEAADANRRIGDAAIYAYYIGSLGWSSAALFCVGSAIFVFSLTFPSIWVNWWAAANEVNPNQNLGKWLGVYYALAVLTLVSLATSCHLLLVTMVKTSAERLHWITLNTVMHAPMRFFAKTDIGVTTNRFSQDMMLIDMELPLGVLNSLATFISCLAQLLVLSITTRYLSAAFPFCIASLYLIQNFYLRTSRQLRFLDLESKSPLYSQFLETLSGLSTIRAFGWQENAQSQNNELLNNSQAPYYLLLSGQTWLGVVLDMFVAGLAVLTMGVAVALQNSISAGFLGVALVNLVNFGITIKAFILAWTTMETSLGAVSRTKNFAETTVSEDLAQEKSQAPPGWPTTGAIDINAVSASYGPDSGLALEDVSMSIAPGQKIGICGSSGSGKSSLILSLFRMIEMTSGSIFIDGVDVCTLPRGDVRAALIALSQESFLFDGSVRLNLDPSSLATDEEIIVALQKAQIWDAIREKGGLDTEIDEVQLSHGQQQLLGLARVILRKGNIIVLDEATSSIDRETENIIQKLIETEFVGRTVISVAHHLHTIVDFDKVAVLSKGKLVEFDSPQALLARQSAFRELYNSSHDTQDPSSPVVDGQVAL